MLPTFAAYTRLAPTDARAVQAPGDALEQIVDDLLVEAPVVRQLIDRAGCGVDQPCSLGLVLTREALLGLELLRGGGQLGISSTWASVRLALENRAIDLGSGLVVTDGAGARHEPF